ncbi:MAG: hypothetical protein VX308_03230 [Candidatus Thermoplasmatota archaeon]|nr:hypothetical protein [Candidatus Thermoplasmatota archaeon]
MSKIEYKRESREWYLASSLIICLSLSCYLVVAWYALSDQSEVFPLLTTAINFSFLLLGLSGLFLAFQGFNYSNNDALLVKLEGEEIALKIENLFLEKNLEIKAQECSSLLDMGLWRPIKLLVLDKGEIEIKELWISAFFYRTQVAIRGNIPRDVFEEYLASLV